MEGGRKGGREGGNEEGRKEGRLIDLALIFEVFNFK